MLFVICLELRPTTPPPPHPSKENRARLFCTFVRCLHFLSFHISTFFSGQWLIYIHLLVHYSCNHYIFLFIFTARLYILSVIHLTLGKILDSYIVFGCILLFVCFITTFLFYSIPYWIYNCFYLFSLPTFPFLSLLCLNMSK